MTNIDFINSKLNEKAQERIDSDFKNMNNLIRTNPILSSLVVRFEDGTSSGIEYLSNSTSRKLRTNILDIKKELYREYIKEEGDKLLAQMSLIEDYLN